MRILNIFSVRSLFLEAKLAYYCIYLHHPRNTFYQEVEWRADTLTRAYIIRQTSVGGQSIIDGPNRVVRTMVVWHLESSEAATPGNISRLRMKDLGKTIYFVIVTLPSTLIT